MASGLVPLHHILERIRPVGELISFCGGDWSSRYVYECLRKADLCIWYAEVGFKNVVSAEVESIEQIKVQKLIDVTSRCEKKV